MKIHGMIQTPSENLEENLATLGQALEVELKVDDIEIAHHLPTPRANRERSLPPPVIVRFASRRKREEVIAASFVNKYLFCSSSFATDRTSAIGPSFAIDLRLSISHLPVSIGETHRVT
uniref:(California timema) hypothetical protein n=1 Tax=Timema californicum TaxID=61474 RepID=A0A7R9JMB3_TIMCA|nr:unnamed protein product [Timema californicum]